MGPLSTKMGEAILAGGGYTGKLLTVRSKVSPAILSSLFCSGAFNFGSIGDLLLKQLRINSLMKRKPVW